MTAPIRSIPPQPLRSARPCALVAVACLGLGACLATSVLAVTPNPPEAPSPTPSAIVANAPAKLFVTVSDPDGDSLDVTFYGRPIGYAGPDFTLIELPDTQHYTSYLLGGTPQIFLAQTNWIVASRVNRNIAYVCQVGDIVENTDTVPEEWVWADICMRPLENPATTLRPEGIPFGVAPGNHDIAGTGATYYYNLYFGIPRFQGRSYYGGHFGNDNANWFELFNASGLDFIVIGIKLMWQQDPAVIVWADSLLKAYPNRRGIIVSHFILDPGPPATPDPRGFGPQGRVIYEGLKGNPNLMLMLCGHYTDEYRREDTYNGHTVHSIMANYQDRAHGGDGWLRIMEFSPSRNQIRNRTYSPWLGRFEVDPDSSSQFTLNVDLSGGDGRFEPIGTIPRVASGSTVSIVWAGLRRGKLYEWYAETKDRSSTVTGPQWRFRLLDDTAPTARIMSPNGGEALVRGTTAEIRWSATDQGAGVSTVDLALSRNGLAGPWEGLAGEIPNTGSYQWRVDGPQSENAYFLVVARDSSGNWAVDPGDGPFQIVTSTGVDEALGGALALDPIAPNPTRGACRFGIALPAPGSIRLDILDVSGREVAVLADGPQAGGSRVFSWSGRGARGPVPAGLYFARLQWSGRVLTRRFVVAR